MMFTFDLIVNPFILVAALIGGILIGLAFRKRKLAKLHSRINQLEDEMMSSHAEILEMQKAYVKMENDLKEKSIPVIPLNAGGKDSQNPKEKASK